MGHLPFVGFPHYSTPRRRMPQGFHRRLFGVVRISYTARRSAAFGGRNAGDGVPYGPNSIRRAETSDRSGNFTRLPSSKTYQARIGPRHCRGGTVDARSLHLNNKIVRIPYAEREPATGRAVLLDGRFAQCLDSNWHRHCRSGGFTRLSSSKTRQTRAWLPAHAGGRCFWGGDVVDWWQTILLGGTPYEKDLCHIPA